MYKRNRRSSSIFSKREDDHSLSKTDEKKKFKAFLGKIWCRLRSVRKKNYLKGDRGRLRGRE